MSSTQKRFVACHGELAQIFGASIMRLRSAKRNVQYANDIIQYFMAVLLPKNIKPVRTHKLPDKVGSLALESGVWSPMSNPGGDV